MDQTTEDTMTACKGTESVAGLEDREEFDEALNLTSAYCKQVSEEAFDEQAVTETEKALEDLTQYLDSHKEEFADFLKKKKRQDLENGGIFSFMKVKVMDMIHGENSPMVSISEKERDRKLEKMKNNMQKALDYTMESKGRRCSKRLQQKREAKTQHDTPTRGSSEKKKKSKSRLPGVPPAPPPPPPAPPLLPGSMPPPPPPPLMETPAKYGGMSLARRPLRPVENRMNGLETPPSVKKSQDGNDSLGSLQSLNCSLTSLHQELLSSNPWKRLRCVDENKSPGGTPGPAKKSLQMGPSSTPLYQALFSNIQEKFRNARSPSPSVLNNSSIMSPQDFTP